MTESSSPDITPKEEPVTLDRPESPNLFLPATQVEFTFDEITFTTNNEVALIYPSHINQEYFMAVDYAKIIWDDLIHQLNKKTREKIVPYPSVHNWILKPNQPKEPPFTDHMKAICNLDVPVDSKAPKYSSPMEEKETKSSSAMDTSPSHPSPPTPVVGEMHKEAHQAAGGPTSLGATDEEGAHPQLSSGSNPSVLVDKTKYAGDGLKTSYTDSGASKKSEADEISKKIKPEDLSDLLKDTRSAFFTPDSPTDEPNIVSDESEKEEVEEAEQPPATSQDKKELEHQKAAAEAEAASLKAKPSYPDINPHTTLLVTSLKPELAKLLASHDFASCLPTELKELPFKIIKLSEEIKELKQHVKDMKLELLGDLQEIPSKLETFTSTISSLSSQVAELKNIQWELQAEFLDLPHLVSSVQEKLKTLDSLSGLLKKVTNTLNRIATLVENASGATTTSVPLADKATASPAEGEKDADTNLKNELVDILGIDNVTRYYNKKLLYEKYCEKMKKKRQSSKIINCDVLTKKGPISLKVYREDGTSAQ
ncbi:hypothetical protein Tco_0057587 [Tanacetum coccineum]